MKSYIHILHGTIIGTEIACKKKSFIKVYLIRYTFEVEHDLLQTRGRIISRYQTNNLLKI